MDHAGHRERLRKRYLQEGLSSFAPHETLELLLTYAIPRVDTNEPAHRLIDRFGSFSGVLEAPAVELQQVEGIGPRSAALISMMLPMLRRYQQEKLRPRQNLDHYPMLRDYCCTLFLGAQVEKCFALCFDAKLNLLATVLLAQGTPGEVAIQPRRVAQELIRYNAVGAVLCHNHPSGTAAPSQADITLTAEVKKVLDAVGLRLYDHVIIAGAEDYSFFNHHLL